MNLNDKKMENDTNIEYYVIKMIKHEEMIEGKNIITYEYPDEKYYVI